MSELSRREIERYQRHLTLPHFGEAAQLKLKRARVLVIGAGGLGSPALQYLAAAGVGRIGIMDFDYVDTSNLHRQVLFADTHVGRLKAEVAAERLIAMNPCIEVEAIPERLSFANALTYISSYDLVVDGSDNFPTRYLVNDACVLANKPLIYGAIYTYQGQVSVFNYQGGPTYRCLFPEPPDPRDAPNCSEIGVLGVLPGVIGTLQAAEAIKVISGIGKPLSGILLLWDMLSMEQRTVRFNRNPEEAAITELKEIPIVCGTPLPGDDPREISVEAFRARKKQDKPVQVLDVREPWERTLETLDSVHLPLGYLGKPGKDSCMDELDTSLTTVVYCRSGVRSLKALPILQEHYGFTEVFSLQGGLLEWNRSKERTMQSSS